MSTGLMTEKGMRAEVADSWHRSAAAGVAADRVEAPITLGEHDLRDHREAHPLAQVFPLLDDVLGQAARDCDAIMAVSDAAGQLLWVCGNPSTLRRAERIGFVEGSNWDERLAGTNAPGLALRLGQPVQVSRAEHFRHSVQHWSCAATPIHDPASTLAARRPRRHRRRRHRGAADDGDGARRGPDGRGGAGPRRC